MNTDTKDDVSQPQRGCNVNMTFNLAVGVTAIIAALLIGYVGYAYWWT